LVDHKNMYCRILYDVEGKILVNHMGRILNAFRPEMDEAFANKEIRLIRNSTMDSICYRYYITSQEQWEKFIWERELGSDQGPNKSYHVYVDDDVDRSSKEYQSLFVERS